MVNTGGNFTVQAGPNGGGNPGGLYNSGGNGNGGGAVQAPNGGSNGNGGGANSNGANGGGNDAAGAQAPDQSANIQINNASQRSLDATAQTVSDVTVTETQNGQTTTVTSGAAPDNVPVNDGAATNGTTPGNGGAATNGGGNGGGGNGGGNGGRGGMNFTSGIYSADGTLVADLSNQNISSAALSGSTLYLLDSQNSQIQGYGVSDGKPLGSAARSLPSAGNSNGGPGGMGGGMMRFFGGGGGSMAVDADSAVYIMDSNNLIQINSDNSSKTLLSGANYSIGNPGSSVDTILPMADGTILVHMTSQGSGDKLYSYVWDASATVDPTKALTVWSLNDSTFVRSAIAAFRTANPGTTVTYDVALTSESGATATDAIKNLNTSLLSGSGPDIIILDGCPVDSYASQGLLLDLTGKVDTSKMFSNVLAPFNSSGKLYDLPGQFEFPALIGQSSSIGQVSTLDALTQAIVSGNNLPAVTPGSNGMRQGFSALDDSQRPVMYFSSLQDVFNVIWEASASEVIQNNTLNTDALSSMLTSLKSISDKYGLGTAQSGNGRNGGGVAFFSAGGAGGAMRVPESTIWYSMERADYGALTVNSLPMLALQSERPDSVLTGFPGLASGSFIPTSVAGVSAGSKVQDLAISFMNTMLGSDVQSVSYNTGLPVTQEGLQAQIDAFNQRMSDAGRTPLSLDVMSAAQGVTQAVMTDDTISTAVWTEAQSLCKGDVDVNKAVSDIEQSVKNYLAERA